MVLDSGHADRRNAEAAMAGATEVVARVARVAGARAAMEAEMGDGKADRARGGGAYADCGDGAYAGCGYGAYAGRAYVDRGHVEAAMAWAMKVGDGCVDDDYAGRGHADRAREAAPDCAHVRTNCSLR